MAFSKSLAFSFGSMNCVLLVCLVALKLQLNHTVEHLQALKEARTSQEEEFVEHFSANDSGLRAQIAQKDKLIETLRCITTNKLSISGSWRPSLLCMN